ncbi:MAG: DUF488 domain-containing protein [Nitrospira sp.]|nr:DUF488 domain-containing protein [Nitrospira sp.]
MSVSPLTLWTIGHSTKPIEDFVALLHAHGIRQLVDVRTIPRSRYNPQFNTEALANSLSEAGIGYRHAGELGGLRKPKNDSINTGWRNDSFRGYADYMQTDAFGKALNTLTTDSREQRTVIMCAEAVPWRCHRSLIADALVNRDWEVRHIMSETKAERHRMTSFARTDEGRLSYQAADIVLRLF